MRSVTSMMPPTCFSSLRSISTLLYFSGLVPNLTMPSLCEIFAKISPLSTIETKYFSASFEFSRPALEATSSKLKVRKVLVNLVSTKKNTLNNRHRDYSISHRIQQPITKVRFKIFLTSFTCPFAHFTQPDGTLFFLIFTYLRGISH